MGNCREKRFFICNKNELVSFISPKENSLHDASTDDENEMKCVRFWGQGTLCVSRDIDEYYSDGTDLPVFQLRTIYYISQLLSASFCAIIVIPNLKELETSFQILSENGSVCCTSNGG